MKGFLRELRDRSVVKVGIAYLVVAWLVLQLADVIFPALNLPDWSITLALALLAIGFPVALVVAWAYDITPAGIRRSDSSISPQLASDNGDVAVEPRKLEAGAGKRSIAVLPFVDMSPDRDHEHFCDGLTDELLNVLTCIPGLRVASRTSSFAFKGKDSDITAVADKLRVSYVLEGSVRKDGDQVRITAQLIEVASDSHLWSQTYDREFCDIFRIQDDIASRILEALRLKLGTGGLPDCTTSDPKAYEYYLRGRGYYVTKSARDTHRAMDMFRKATEKDPGFVRAWVDLAEAAAMGVIFLGEGEEIVRLAERASRKAMELAPNRADSHLASGFASLAAHKFAEAEPHLLKALELDPSQTKALHYLARAARHQGDTAKEVEYFVKATDQNEEDWESPLLAMGTFRETGDLESARSMAAVGVERARRHHEDYPDNPRAYYLATGSLLFLGEKDLADKYAERALEIAPDDGPTRYNVACYYAQIGEADKALDLLEGSIHARSWIENDRDWDRVRDHPRYQAVIESLKE